MHNTGRAKQTGLGKLVRSPYQTCADMLSLLRTHTEELKWTSKRKISIVKAVRNRMRGAPEPGAPAPATGHSPRILFLTALTIDYSRYEVHFSCSVGLLRRGSMSAHVWYGLRINLIKTPSRNRRICNRLNARNIFYQKRKDTKKIYIFMVGDLSKSQKAFEDFFRRVFLGRGYNTDAVLYWVLGTHIGVFFSNPVG